MLSKSVVLKWYFSIFFLKISHHFWLWKSNFWTSWQLTTMFSAIFFFLEYWFLAKKTFFNFVSLPWKPEHPYYESTVRGRVMIIRYWSLFLNFIKKVDKFNKAVVPCRIPVQILGWNGKKKSFLKLLAFKTIPMY